MTGCTASLTSQMRAGSTPSKIISLVTYDLTYAVSIIVKYTLTVLFSGHREGAGDEAYSSEEGRLVRGKSW